MICASSNHISEFCRRRPSYCHACFPELARCKQNMQQNDFGFQPALPYPLRCRRHPAHSTHKFPCTLGTISFIRKDPPTNKLNRETNAATKDMIFKGMALYARPALIILKAIHDNEGKATKLREHDAVMGLRQKRMRCCHR